MHGAIGHPKYGLILWEARPGSRSCLQSTLGEQPCLRDRRTLRGKNTAAARRDQGDTLTLHPLPLAWAGFGAFHKTGEKIPQSEWISFFQNQSLVTQIEALKAHGQVPDSQGLRRWEATARGRLRTSESGPRRKFLSFPVRKLGAGAVPTPGLGLGTQAWAPGWHRRVPWVRQQLPLQPEWAPEAVGGRLA